MKRIGFRLSSTIALLTLGAIAASASTTVEKFRVNVPFDFVAGKSVLPAGSYTVVCNSVPGIVQISDQKGKIRAALNMHEKSVTGVQDKSSVTFNHRGEQYFLAGVKRRGYDRVYAPEMSRLERELISAGK